MHNITDDGKANLKLCLRRGNANSSIFIMDISLPNQERLNKFAKYQPQVNHISADIG